MKLNLTTEHVKLVTKFRGMCFKSVVCISACTSVQLSVIGWITLYIYKILKLRFVNITRLKFTKLITIYFSPEVVG